MTHWNKPLQEEYYWVCVFPSSPMWEKWPLSKVLREKLNPKWLEKVVPGENETYPKRKNSQEEKPS